MIAHLISKIRKEKGITKTQLAYDTDINIGHLTHIEKGERNPSHRALRMICYKLGIPYQPASYLYDRELSEEQEEYGYINHIIYNQVPAISKIDEYITCPAEFPNAAFAFKVPDKSMEPLIKEGDYSFIEVSGLIGHKGIGLFLLNGQYLIRRLIYKNDKFVLRSDNKSYKDITVNTKDSFQIIGRVYI